MKIIHLTDEIWDSGLTDYALTLAYAQKQAGENIYFGCLANCYAHKKAQAMGLDVINIYKSPFGYTKFAKTLSEIKPNVVNAHTGSCHTMAIIAKKISFRKPVIIRTRADARKFTKKPFAKLLWKNTDGFIAANSKILDDFNRKTPADIAGILILQAIDVPSDKIKTSPNPNTIGILARLDPVKGHKTAMEAVNIVKNQISDIVLLVAGEEQNIKYDELENYAKKLNIMSNIRFSGFIEDKYEFINSCSVGIVPSVASEAVCRVALEWISQAKPVIASNVGGISDIINTQIGILTQPQNPKALANAIEVLLSDREKLLVMGAKARKYFKQNFTLDIFERKTTDFYKEIISDKLASQIEKI